MQEKNIRVLLVEDEALLGQYIAAQLANFNFDCVLHQSVEDIEEVMRQENPDVILMDVVFPEGDLAGPEAMQRLVSAGHKLPPVIAYSSRVDFQARLASIRAGAVAYYPKPLDFAVLAEKINRLIEPAAEHPAHVLVVDDSRTMSSYYSALLQQAGVIARAVNDPATVQDVLADFPAELILMDMYMPHCSGSELAALLRQQDTFVSIPIVFLSSEQDLGRQLGAMRAGGDEFLSKPIEPDHLISVVDSRVRRYRELQRFMVRDSLTGLLNHSSFEVQLDKEVARARRQSVPFCLAMLDVDYFKKVNDTYGHPVGDQVLRGLARLLQQRLRKTDIIARYGGEEFAVVLSNTTMEGALMVMDTIRLALANLVFCAGVTEFCVTFSCGIAQWTAEHSDSLTSEADKALYVAKNSGRNRICVAGKSC